MTSYFYTASGDLEIIETVNNGLVSARLYPWHIHLHHWTAGRVASGAVSLTLKSATGRYRAGEIFLIPPRVPHQLSIEPGSALTVLSYASPSGLAGLAAFLASKNSEAPLLAEAGLRRLFCAARDLTTRCQPITAAQTDSMAAAVADIAAQIIARPQTEFSLAAMAEQAGFSRWHFLRCFCANTGMTPHAWQIQCRIRLLRAGIRLNADLASLAVSTGFTDQSHMHKLFKRHHCLTPKQFRRASFSLPL